MCLISCWMNRSFPATMDCETNGARRAAISRTCKAVTRGLSFNGRAAAQLKACRPYFDPSIATKTFISSILSCLRTRSNRRRLEPVPEYLL